MNTRFFIHLATLSALLGYATSCAVNPVTGKKQLVLMSDRKSVV